MTSLKKLEDLDIQALVVSTTTSFVKRRPITISIWVVGLLLAAFADGFRVDEAALERYHISLDEAQDVESKELSKATKNFRRIEDKYLAAKGWWSCDDTCQKLKDKSDMAKADLQRVQKKRESIMREAYQEVGIWSVFGVREVRKSFWAAWESGKDFAKRYTMMDAFFLMMGGKEETMVSFILKIVMQYIMNLTVGLFGAFIYFVYSVYNLIVTFGASFASGLAFFLLVLVASVATLGTYLIAIYGTFAGGTLYLAKQAAKHAALEGQRGTRPRQVQYNRYHMGPGGPGRPHYE